MLFKVKVHLFPDNTDVFSVIVVMITYLSTTFKSTQSPLNLGFIYSDWTILVILVVLLGNHVFCASVAPVKLYLCAGS